MLSEWLSGHRAGRLVADADTYYLIDFSEGALNAHRKTSDSWRGFNDLAADKAKL